MAVTNPLPSFKNPVAVGAGFGRFFYGVGSTVYFTQVLQNSRGAGKCFQNNDPTSDDISDLLDTDGGFLILDGAAGIKRIVPFRTGVLCFAENGVWYVYNPDGGFTATSFNVSKVTERGISSPRSVVAAEGVIFYASDNGIIQIVANEFDNLQGVDFTEQTVRQFYIDNFNTANVLGDYDQINKEIWWVNQDTQKALVFDLQSQGFYPQANESSTNIGKPLNVDTNFYYPSFQDLGTTYEYSFSSPSNRSFLDFGEPQNAYLVSGFETLGKFSHKKSVTEAKIYFQKTETQILGYENNQYVYDFPSSCLFQARWDFDNSNAYSKWVGRTTSQSGSGKKVQLYNPMRRGFIPDQFPWDFDTGESLIRTKYNIRGNGDAVQFRFEAQEGNDMRLLGYSVNYSMRGKI